MINFSVQNERTIFLLHPLTPAAIEWVSEHLLEDAQTWGSAIVVEHRYISNIVQGAAADGLVCQ